MGKAGKFLAGLGMVVFLAAFLAGCGGGGGASGNWSGTLPTLYNGYFSGQVINAADGYPAPHISVEIRDKDGFFYGRFGANDKGEFSDRGELQMLGPIKDGTITAYYFDGPIKIDGLSPTIMPFSLEPGATHPPIRMVMVKGPPMQNVIITGRVVNALGAPVANINISVSGIMGILGNNVFTTGILAFGKSQADGWFSLEFPLAGKTEVHVFTSTTSDYWSAAVNDVLNPGQAHGLGTIVVPSK